MHANWIPVTAPPSPSCPIEKGNTIQIAHKKFVKRNSPQKPSATAILSTFHDQQDVRGQAIPCGCPFTFQDCIPTTLLHPIFSQFVEDICNISLTACDNMLAMDLAIAMSALYPDKATWVEKIHNVLETFEIHLNITKTKITGYETDGEISTWGYHFMLAEFKNETGSSSGEPYFQTIGYYLKTTRLHVPKMPNSPIPCLLLSIFGPFFQTSTLCHTNHCL